MKKYIALLRGVNVGGKNHISMPELKADWQDHGFNDVITYINSGNIIFSTVETDEKILAGQCQALIGARFGLPIAVAVISAADLAETLAHAPEWWNRDADAKHNAIFVIPPISAEEVIKEVGAGKPEYEQVAYHGGVIFWSAPLKTFSHTRWSKIVGTAAYAYVTIRNANTTGKLLLLAEK